MLSLCQALWAESQADMSSQHFILPTLRICFVSWDGGKASAGWEGGMERGGREGEVVQCRNGKGLSQNNELGTLSSLCHTAQNFPRPAWVTLTFKMSGKDAQRGMLQAREPGSQEQWRETSNSPFHYISK